MSEKNLPLLLRLEKARNELRFSVNTVAGKYDLPGFLIDLILEAVLSEERAQRIALIGEQVTTTTEETEDDENGKREDLSQ